MNSLFSLFKRPLKKLYNFQLYSTLLDNNSTIYTEDHRSFQSSLIKLINTEINPYINEWEKAEIFPAKKIMKLFGAGGFLGADKPKEYGGLGLDYTYNIAISEAIGHIECGGVAMGLSVQLSMVTPALVNFGSDKLKKEYLIPTINGDVVACLGVSEAGAGSDVSAIKTNAVRDGDDLIINGEKMWITSGTQADWMCLLANTELNEKNKYHNKSLIIVPMNSKGIATNKIKKMGMLSSDTAQIHFDNVRVPLSHIIGKPGHGFIYQMKQFQEERMSGTAATFVPLERVIIDTLQYASQRQIYGKALLHNQVRLNYFQIDYNQ